MGMDYAAWVKQARERAGKTQEDLGIAVGVTKANVSAWEHGRHAPRLEHVYAISRVTGQPTPPGLERHHVKPLSGVVYIPLMQSEMMLTPIEHRRAHQTPAVEVVLPESFIEALHLKKPDALRMLHAYDDSMEPTISAGDTLLADSSVRQIAGDGVYVLSANSRVFVRRVRQRLDGSHEVSSDNPTQKTTETLSEGVQVLGRVLWSWHGKSL